VPDSTGEFTDFGKAMLAIPKNGNSSGKRKISISMSRSAITFLEKKSIRK
jgi:hypothetical protein